VRHPPKRRPPTVTVRRAIDEIDLAPILADHARMRDVCDALERLAECTAESPLPEERRTCAERMQAVAVDHLKATSAFFLQVFGGNESRFTRRMLARILLRQISDALHAEEVAQALAAESAPLSVIRLGDMLRPLFEGWRRALEFEELSLLSLGQDRLTGVARAKLEGLLA